MGTTSRASCARMLILASVVAAGQALVSTWAPSARPGVTSFARGRFNDPREHPCLVVRARRFRQGVQTAQQKTREVKAAMVTPAIASPVEANSCLQEKYSAILESTDDPEAQHLWSKLPDEIKGLYSYQGVLGRGAFGIVVCAHSTVHAPAHLPSRMAVKLIRTVYGAEPLAMREGLVHHSIDNHQIPKCYDYGISQGVVYILAELVPGSPLTLSEGPLSAHEVAQVGCQVAAALGAIHATGFVFRDVKPQNILRVGGGKEAMYRLVDFGAAVGINNCLFGSAQTAENDRICHLDPDPAFTRVRLKSLFQSLCRRECGSLPISDLEEVSCSTTPPRQP